MLTPYSVKSQNPNPRQLLSVAKLQQFETHSSANSADYETFGVAPPSSRSRRAARWRRQNRISNGGWRSGIGSR